MALLRDYHAAIGEIIIKYNGTLERYAGRGARCATGSGSSALRHPLDLAHEVHESK